MKLQLTILLLLTAFLSQAQTNTNPLAYKYKTLAEAITRKGKLNATAQVMEDGVGGDFVIDTLTGTADNVITFDQGGKHCLRRIFTQATGINLSWAGIKYDSVTDNYSKLNYLFSTSFPYKHFILDKPGGIYSSQSLSPQKNITIDGPDGYEMPNGTVAFIFPQGVNGFIFNSISCAGSVLRGFTIQSTLPESGRILEYNPANGTMLYISPLFTLTAGKTFQFKDSYSPDKVKGTAVISSAGTNNIVFAVNYTLPSGTFAIGDTVKGATSGAKATVRFVSRYYNALAVGVITGTFKAGETITGTSSGASAKFVNVPVPARWQFAKVATISSVTGSLDAPQSDTTSTTDSSIVNADTLQFAVSGNIDSLGASGKRQNIFVESGKYSTGMTLNRRITMEDMTIAGFGGDGIYISNITTPVSNANLCRLNRVRSNANAGNGIRINGGDANHISLENSTFVNNAAWGICDMSFLGIAVNTVHTSVDMVGGGTTGTYINRKSTWLNFYSEGAYNGMLPWQSAENTLGGAATKIGGTDGLTNHTPYWSTAGNGGAEYSSNNIQNNYIYTDLSNVHDPKIVFKSTGGITHNIVVSNQGAPSVGRGGTYGFRSPAGAGYQGTDIKNADLDMGNILGSQATGSTYGYDFFLRRNVPPAMTVTGSNGKGAVLQVDILNGKATKVNVLAGGKGYPKNSTTITAANFPNTVFNPIIEDSVITDVQILGDSLTTNSDNDIYSVAQILSNGAFRPTTNKGGSLGDPTHHWATLYADSIVSAGTASNQYIWNQKASQQAGDFYIGTTGSTITNHSAVTATPNSNIINSGLNVIARSGADGYYSPFHVYMNGAASGMHFNTWGSNNTSISGGGYARQLANGILGGYYFLDNQISAIAFKDGTIHYLLGNGTAGNIGTLTDVGGIDTTGTYTIIPKASATDALVAQRTIGANVNKITIGGSDGRTIGAYQNGTLNNMNINANSVFFNSGFILGPNKNFQLYNSAGTQQGFYQMTTSPGSWNFLVNVSTQALKLTDSGRVIVGGPINPKSYTVATLPSASTNDICFVTDALNPVSGQTVAGGGTSTIPVYRNSTNWIAMGSGGYWQRIGTTLRPVISGDNVTVDKTLKIGSVATGNTTAMDVVMYNPVDSSVNRVSTGNFLNANHPQTTGSAPSVSGGTNVTASMNSTAKDAKFQLTLTVGSGGATGTVATVIFNSAWTQTPTAVFSPANAAAAGANNQVYADATSTTTLVVSSTGTLAAGTYIFNFHVEQ